MRKYQKGFTLIELFVVIFAVGGAIGWVWNIVKIFGLLHTVHGMNDAGFVMLVVRIIGAIVVPFGAVMGYIPN